MFSFLKLSKNGSKKIVVIFKTVIFLILMLLISSYVMKTLKFKYADGIYKFDMFYEQEPNSIDALVLGTSHAFTCINPAVLYTEFGIAAFDLTTSSQPIWNTYFYLEEALKTQSPKVVILEAYGLANVGKRYSHGLIISSNFGLKWSSTKLKSLQVSAPKNKFSAYAIEPYQYHTKYSDLKEEDFNPHLGKKIYENWKGFTGHFYTTPLKKPDIPNTIKSTKLSERAEYYYRSIIELCIKKNIPIHIIVTPYLVTEREQMKYNEAELIAGEYGIPFTNYNFLYDEIGLDFSTDMYDRGHTNNRGSIKVSHAIGKLLKQNYELPDRKDNPNWESWLLDANIFWQSVENQKTKEIVTWDDYYKQINKNPSYSAIISVSGILSSSYQPVKDILSSFDIGNEYYDLSGTWVIEDGKVVFSDDDKLRSYVQLGTLRADFSQTNLIRIDKVDYPKIANGVTILIYDSITDSIIDSIRLDVSNVLEVKRG